MKRFILLLSSVFVVAACQTEAVQPVADPPNVNDPAPENRTPTDPPTNENENKAQDPAPSPGQLGHGMQAALLPPKIVEEAPLRNRRRMDIDQLDRSIQRVTGGIAWTLGNKKINQFGALAQTLGKPNFLDLTREDLDPSALFQKFLDDAARSVCAELVVHETEVVSSERVLMVHVSPQDTWESNPAGVNKNLAYLLLRYHGRKVEVDAAEMEQWRWLFRSAQLVAKQPVTAWRTVCVGLMTHPYFYTY
ncbi:MAG TPA: hypothetical protein EYN06_05735 [Myxococcales bacterium]|nr:hypothetical protein [Myxococcales bacterium]HIN85964.1 hypothetical protein [Myxococcales bacterium]